MQFEQSFIVPVGIDDAWKVLTDIGQVVPCMPGAALDRVEGDEFIGTVKVKLGAISLTYRGKASFVEKDEAKHRAVIRAQGRDARGNGTAAATVRAALSAIGSEAGTGGSDGTRLTKVDVVTDFDITGKPAQFGRGVMLDVSNVLIGQFADCLATKLSGKNGPAPEAPPPAHPSAPTVATRPVEGVPPIDLIATATPAVVKRVGPVVGGLLLVLLVILVLRRRGR